MNRKAAAKATAEISGKAAARDLDKSATRSWIRESTKAAAEKEKAKAAAAKKDRGKRKSESGYKQRENDTKARGRQVSGAGSGGSIAPPGC